MQIPIDTAPLRALDVPTRWLLAQAFEDAERFAVYEIAHKPTDDEAKRKREVYKQMREALR